MCGIWTFFGRDPGQSTPRPVSHRGPDDHGVVTLEVPSGFLTLESYRLSILDVSSAGHQPMWDRDRRFVLVFNGEIYNYVELAEELADYGRRFDSRSDTEVLLAAWAEWGSDCLPRLRGMFAFCLYDVERRVLFVARDRYGIKPLYYWNTSNGVAIASEIKQFTGLSWWKPRLNYSRAADFLVCGFLDHTDETLFCDVRLLRGGELMAVPLSTWDIGQPLPISKWDRARDLPPYGGTFPDAVGEYRRRFRESIRLHLRSDVTVGSCLSGGLDSSAVVLTARQILEEQGSFPLRKTFTSVSDVPKYDERPHAEAVAAVSGAEAVYLVPSSDGFFENLDCMVWSQDEPFDNGSVYAQWLIFREARNQGVKVMLDGQGGDEHLQSYEAFFAPRIGTLIRSGQWHEAVMEARSFWHKHHWRGTTLLQNLAVSWTGAAGRHALLRRAAGNASRPWLRRDWIADSYDGASGAGQFLAGLNVPGTTKGLSKQMLSVSPLPMLLHWEDRNSMAHSVEARVPFLDRDVVDFSLSLPDSYKTYRGTTKRILREATGDLLPARVLARIAKLGFATSEEVWFKTAGNTRVKEAHDRLAAAFPQIFDARAFQAEYDGHQQTMDASSVCRLLTFEAWARVFDVRL